MIAAALGSTAAGGAVTYAGRLAVLKARGQDAEATRVWARLEAEEIKRAALEVDVEALRTERHELLAQLVDAHRAAAEAAIENTEALRTLQHENSQLRHEVHRLTAEVASLRDQVADSTESMRRRVRTEVRRSLSPPPTRLPTGDDE